MQCLIQHADEAARFLKLIANTNRLLILCQLCDHEANVGQLEERLGVSQPALSQHLARMRQEGVLDTRRNGQQVFYSIKDMRVIEMVKSLETILGTDVSNG